MPRLSLYARQHIVVLATEYTYSYGRIRKELAKESIEVSISAIYRLLEKHRQSNLKKFDTYVYVYLNIKFNDDFISKVFRYTWDFYVTNLTGDY